MHTIPALGTRQEWAAYHHALQSDHDFRIDVDILNMEEDEKGSATLLDGQINFSRNADDGPERTASLSLSDPEGALQFGTSFAEDDAGVLWVNRLVRVRHSLWVDALDKRVAATCMVGVPTAVARRGPVVELELGDKSILADHGVRAKTYKKGMRVDVALKSILKDLTGEWHLRIPPAVTKDGKPKVLSRSYTVGMGENSLTPWRLAKRIAGVEMGWRLYYSADGYATAEPTSTQVGIVPVEHVLALPESSAAFTEFVNYAKVTSTRKVTNRQRKALKLADNVVSFTYEGVAVLPSEHVLSEQSLSRHGVPRTLPLVITDNGLKSQKEVNDRTVAELRSGSDITYDQSYEIMPFFHLDSPDKFDLPMDIGIVEFDEVSIPLGVGGNMTLGKQKWVSRPVTVKRVRSKRTVNRKKKKGGKKNDD